MNKTYLLAAAVGLIATTAIVATATFALQGIPGAPGHQFSSEQHQAVIEAIDNNDYQAWKELMGDHPIAEKITEENFAKFVQARQLMKEGNFEEARALREELGLGVGRGFKMKNGFSAEQEVAVLEAINNNDYKIWKELMGDNKITEIITEENFSKFREAYQLMQQAQTIFEELGLPAPGKAKGFGMGIPKRGNFGQ